MEAPKLSSGWAKSCTWPILVSVGIESLDGSPIRHDRRFFIRCMKLIAENDREEEEEDDCEVFKGELSTRNLF
jgi:hypothetical protein